MNMRETRIDYTGLNRKREKKIEAALVSRVEKMAGYAIKLSAYGRRGLPDRMVILKGRIIFIEVKSPGEEPSRQQRLWLDRLTQLGFKAVVLDSVEGIDEVLA